uniref:Uncharacterized protein n=1 Tax=Chromera velia CCMP2878 TaxID=1169474 RepID=A0A0G4HUG9_9ALVE|eukprot:Cvel_8617.t1-p1 / transcript=Cvel_8617.t1 / gene=Cvel_8617 / organism=Chromera_velia_CCMP2878 / gene_product=hypothetical protein / transcript_product=hypothetical protein / location=Cvel_scaffold479:81253-83051(-) / protein_length=190 / sequence_SO=supercontig / SO=protein_coding / is_pseudo=false
MGVTGSLENGDPMLKGFPLFEVLRQTYDLPAKTLYRYMETKGRQVFVTAYGLHTKMWPSSVPGVVHLVKLSVEGADGTGGLEYVLIDVGTLCHKGGQGESQSRMYKAKLLPVTKRLVPMSVLVGWSGGDAAAVNPATIGKFLCFESNVVRESRDRKETNWRVVPFHAKQAASVEKVIELVYTKLQRSLQI